MEEDISEISTKNIFFDTSPLTNRSTWEDAWEREYEE